jgi:hypothetical protein
MAKSRFGTRQSAEIYQRAFNACVGEDIAHGQKARFFFSAPYYFVAKLY